MLLYVKLTAMLSKAKLISSWVASRTCADSFSEPLTSTRDVCSLGRDENMTWPMQMAE